MWLINTTTGEEGWHVAQMYQTDPCEKLVFVRDGGSWRIKYWKNTEIKLRAKNREEELVDEAAMRAIQFPFQSHNWNPPPKPNTSGWFSWLPWPFNSTT